MKFTVKEIVDTQEKRAISREILNDLPEWFGIPESNEQYIVNSQDKCFLAAFLNDKIVGFLVLNSSSKDCAEIFVMGVKKKFHRQGAGELLIEAYETMAKEKGFTYSQVKTVQAGHYKEYDITNEFFVAMGYKELECFPKLWSENNPCQIYIKYIGN